MSLKPFIIALLAGVLASSASAQEPPPGVELAMERVSSLTTAEKVEYAAAALVEMREMENAMAELVKEAPECVNAQLVLLRTVIEVTITASDNMNAYLAKGNTARGDAEARRVVLLLERARSIRAEAKDCTSSRTSGEGDESRSVEYNGRELGTGNETMDETDFSFDAQDDPPEASPFM